MISKAKTACELSGQGIADRLAVVGQMIELEKDRQREVFKIKFQALIPVGLTIY